MDSGVRKNSAKAWLLATRPQTLTGALIPVVLATALAVRHDPEHLRLSVALLCAIFASLMQIAANLINDLMDFLKGSDREDRLGPPRACQMGWISPGSMKCGIALTLALSAFSGLGILYLSYPLMPWHGLELILCGLMCFLFAFLYTTHLSYLGLGDVLVLVFFGFVPVVMTYYLLRLEAGASVWLMGLISGILIDSLLLVNNIRDINEDLKSGKMTLIVRIGKQRGQKLYLLSGALACLLTLPLAIMEDVFLPYIIILFGLYIPLHRIAYARMKEIGEGKALNGILKDNSRNMMLFAVVLSILLALGL